MLNLEEYKEKNYENTDENKTEIMIRKIALILELNFISLKQLE